jgi:hypothetical protein
MGWVLRLKVPGSVPGTQYELIAATNSDLIGEKKLADKSDLKARSILLAEPNAEAGLAGFSATTSD